MRVLALSHTTETHSYIFGFGICTDTEVVQGHIVPKVVLDNGKVVYGHECWIFEDNDIPEEVADKEIIEIDIDTSRVLAAILSTEEHIDPNARKIPVWGYT